MNLNQKLADIQALMAYIKEHIDAGSLTMELEKIEEIGNQTLKIAEMLKGIEQKIGTGTGNASLAGEYKRAVDDMSDKMLKQLIEIKAILESTKESQSDSQQDIKELYTEYAEMVEGRIDALAKQREEYDKKVLELNTNVKELSETVLNASGEQGGTELAALVKQLGTQMEKSIEWDKQMHASYIKSAARLESLSDKIHAAYDAMDEKMAEAEKKLAATSERLDSLLVQLEEQGKGKKGKRWGK